jgi:hypothetical protein
MVTRKAEGKVNPKKKRAPEWRGGPLKQSKEGSCPKAAAEYQRSSDDWLRKGNTNVNSMKRMIAIAEAQPRVSPAGRRIPAANDDCRSRHRAARDATVARGIDRGGASGLILTKGLR